MASRILIGEIGLSHEGSLGSAISMVQRAKEVGLDAVKFQMHLPEFESTNDERFRVNVFPQDKSRFDYWQRTSFTKDEWTYIYRFCQKIDISFLCTPFSKEAALFLKSLGEESIKIASGDFNNLELIEFAKDNFNTIYLSTGFCYLDEIESTYKLLSSGKATNVVLLQCTSKYPTPLCDVGLDLFCWFEKRQINYGLSDHTGNKHVIMAAIGKGAQVIEFHLVFSRSQFGPDAHASLTFEEAKEVVDFKNVYQEVSSPNYSKDAVAKELEEVRRMFGRGLALRVNKEKGELVLREDLVLKKPHSKYGWSHVDKFAGRKLAQNVPSNRHISEEDFE